MNGTRRDRWPDLSGAALPATIETLHLWTQIVGKIRMMATPWENHGWHVPLYVSARGLATGLVPAAQRAFSIEFDLLDSNVEIRDTDGGVRHVPLVAGSVASFYTAIVEALDGLGIQIRINTMPNELDEPVPFPDDHLERAYDPPSARAYWHALMEVQRVFQLFRTRFVGKCSPIHLFWGAFDLAVTRFSGRAAPPHGGGVPYLPDAVAREAYCQEVSSAGFWPGNGAGGEACFYSYAYPSPPGFEHAIIRPEQARYDGKLGEFLLSYEAVRTSADPDGALLEFLETTYVAAADLAGWDRVRLERASGDRGRPPAGS